MKENVDYELIPGDDNNWNFRILTGHFLETVFSFGRIQVTEDGEYLKYNAEVISTPNDDIGDESEEWHQVTGDILIDVLEQAALKNESRTNNPS